MKNSIMKNTFRTLAALGLSFSLSSPLMAVEAVDLDQLLQQVKAGRGKDAQESAARLEAFRKDRANQQNLLAQMQGEQRRQEQLSQRLEGTFEVNDVQLIELEAQLQERLGDLKELFGVLQQAAGDAIGQFGSSITQAQFPERSAWLTEFATKMGQTNRLASLEEIERLWFEIQREMTETGKVASFPATVISSTGEELQETVIRVGAFNLVADGKYLEFVPETGRVVELQRQPQDRYLSRIEDLEEATSGQVAVAIDPTRGQLLGLLVQSPNLMERINQGGVVGHTILVLGSIGLLIAIWRLLVLSGISAKVRAQLKTPGQPGDNPLGRVIKVRQDHPGEDIESLELHLGEQILKEMPKFNAMLPLIKIISVVAPLLGLLGTVTGMIITFQAITLYGAGDPKLMAGGISTALVTTVEGLVVAIPMVFLYALVASRARSLAQILQEEAAGILAEEAEKQLAHR